MALDFEMLPLTDLAWEQRLKISRLGIIKNEETLLDLSLLTLPGCLQTLDCEGNRLTALDLTPVPKLETLKCSLNELTELDLTHVPRLQTLDCEPESVS